MLLLSGKLNSHSHIVGVQSVSVVHLLPHFHPPWTSTEQIFFGWWTIFIIEILRKPWSLVFLEGSEGISVTHSNIMEVRGVWF